VRARPPLPPACEQKKRLSIAVEILHMPFLIFLDEPTSGLDAVMSYEVRLCIV
jgi:ABC-type multidrug transport system ATPase subunit